jgi:nitroimidazol reductase NimA-like FMN-containing flavoprotein (pyridoxamine 5'-phosphate oxidase superfamily)
MHDEQAHQANRGYLRDLGDNECWERMGETGIGRVAMCSAEGPVILPVNYLVDDRTVIVRTAPYTQLAAHVRETLAFEVDEFEPDMRRGWSVLIIGEAVALDDPDELAELRPQQRLEPWAPGSRNLFIRITPRQITGRVLQ